MNGKLDYFFWNGLKQYDGHQHPDNNGHKDSNHNKRLGMLSTFSIINH